MKKEDMYLGLPVANTVAGQRVFGVVAGFHKTTGNPILRDFSDRGCRWLADVDKCEPLTTENLCRKNGFVTFG